MRTCISEHFVTALLRVYKQPESLALLWSRLDWVRLIPEWFAKNIEFQCVDWVTARLIWFASEGLQLWIHSSGVCFTEAQLPVAAGRFLCTNLYSSDSTTYNIHSRCSAAPWVSECARCAPAGLDSCPSRPRWGPGWAAPPGRSAPSHPSPGPPPGSPTGTGSPPASAAAHACPAPAPAGLERLMSTHNYS